MGLFAQPGRLCCVYQHRSDAQLQSADSDSTQRKAYAVTTINSIGTNMLSTGENGYLLPFEAVSVLLLACIVGALLIARKR